METGKHVAELSKLLFKRIVFFYFAFIVIVLFLLFLSKAFRVSVKKRNPFEWLALFIIVFIAIFRFDVGWDYVNYYNYIDNVEILQILRLEPLSQIFCYIAILFESPPLLFVLFGLPTYLILFYTLKRYSVGFVLSLLVYLAFFYLESLTSIRQTLALSITFWGFRYILKRSFIKYMLVVALSAMFHMSAVAAILIYPVYYLLNLRSLAIMIPVLFLLKEVVFRMLSSYGPYAYYLDKLEDFTGGGIVRYVQIALYFSLLILGLVKKIDRSQNKLFTLIGIALLFPFIFGPALGTRLGMYFLIYQCILIPSILSKYSLPYKVIYASCFSLYFLVMIYIGSKNEFKSLYIPYQFIFNIENPQFR